ncbi:MAG: TatD family hydrolase [Caldiserica bacterium]|nr:TatD family hydrolase [Caldisericota bacterium]
MQFLKREKPVFLVDTHSHLYDIPRVESVLAECDRKGIVVLGVGEEMISNQKILEISRKFPGLVYPAIGLHPFLLGNLKVEEEISWLKEHIEFVVALGEIGLDYKGEEEPDRQKEVFKKLLSLAIEYQKPVIIHSRRAVRDCVEIVKEMEVERAIFHWFSGSPSLVGDIVSAGGYLSVNPAIGYSHGYKRVIERAPIDRLILETDSPVPYKGKPTTPLEVVLPLRMLSELKGIPEEDIARITTENFFSLFPQLK